MATMATFRTTAGTKSWEISPTRVTDVDSLTTSHELEADNNSSVEGSPLSNQRGKKKAPLSFSSTISAHLGYDVRAEYESWGDWIGLSGILRIGGTRFGTNWLLLSVKASNVLLDANGRWRSAKLAFSFEESDDSTIAQIEEMEEAIQAQNSAVGCVPPETFITAKKPYNSFVAALNKARTGTTLTICLNDTVRFTGGVYYMACTSSAEAGISDAGIVKVLKIANGAAHPYFVMHVDNNSTVAGWVDGAALSL